MSLHVHIYLYTYHERRNVIQDQLTNIRVDKLLTVCNYDVFHQLASRGVKVSLLA